jgi:hypothetical protein
MRNFLNVQQFTTVQFQDRPVTSLVLMAVIAWAAAPEIIDLLLAGLTALGSFKGWS